MTELMEINALLIHPESVTTLILTGLHMSWDIFSRSEIGKKEFSGSHKVVSNNHFLELALSGLIVYSGRSTINDQRSTSNYQRSN